MTDCEETEAADATDARLQLLWVASAEAFVRVVPPVLPSKDPSTPQQRRPGAVDAETAGEALRRMDDAAEALAARGAGRALFAKGSFVPLAAAVLTALLQVAQHHADRALRLACLEALAHTLALVADPRALAAVLPGVSTTLAAIATGDYKQGRRVTAAALRAWAALVGAVCADSVSPEGSPSSSSWVATTAEKIAGMAGLLFAPGRGPPRMDACEVRLALVEAARTVACGCTRLALRGGALAPALDCLVLHADDDAPEVAAAACTALADLAARDQETDSEEEEEDEMARAARVLAALGRDGGSTEASPSLHSVMAERLQYSLRALEGAGTRAIADEPAIAALRTAAGYVTLLRARLGAIMPGIVGTLVPALVALVEVDGGPSSTSPVVPASPSPVAVTMLRGTGPSLLPAVPAVLLSSDSNNNSSVLNSAARQRQRQREENVAAFAASAGVAEGLLTATETTSNDDDDEWGDNGYPPLPMRHFGDTRVWREARRLSSLLGTHDASGLFCSELEAGVRALAAPEAVALLAPAVVGAVRADRQPRTALSACAKLVLAAHADHGGDLLGAAVVRAVGDLCCCCEENDDESEALVQSVLYPVLELLGDGTRTPAGPLLASAARTLTRTAEAAHTSVAGLVSAHADALTDAVARRLRAPTARARAPFVFRALLHVAGAAFVPLVRDTLGAALRALRAGSLLAGTDMLAVLDEVALAMARVGTVKDSEGGEDESDDGERLTAAALRADIGKQLTLRRTLEKPADSLQGLTGEARIKAIQKYMAEHAQNIADKRAKEEQQEEEKEKKKPPPSMGPRLLDEEEQRVVLLGRVLETAVPYLSSASPAVCVQALGVLDHGIAAMVANGGARTRSSDDDNEEGGGSPPLWPLLHRCCGPLLRRVQDARAPAAVALRAAEVLATVLRAGRAFLASERPSAALTALALRIHTATTASSSASGTARLLACVARIAGPGGCDVPRASRRAVFDACADALDAAPEAAERALAAIARVDAPAVWAWCNARIKRDDKKDSKQDAALHRVAQLCTEVDDP